MVDDFDPHITCEEVEKAKDVPQYVRKAIVFDSSNTHLFTPIKTLDMDGLTRETYPLYSNVSGPFILESHSYVSRPQTWESINEIIEDDINNTTRLLKILKLKPNLYRSLPQALATTSVVFSKNPFEERVSTTGMRYPPLDRENFETFLQDLYSYSRGIVLVPDIKIAYIPKSPPHIPKTRPTIGTDEYLSIIDEFTSILSERNNTPIFVPIQTSLTKKATNQILSFYKRKGYSNIWINLGAGEVWGRNLAGLRTILNTLNAKFGPENCVLYCSHMKKELTPNIKDDRTASSDMLSQFFGVDMIGVNREPMRFFSQDGIEKTLERGGYSSLQEYQYALQLHKARIFDPLSYFYYKPGVHPSLSESPFSIDDLNRNVPKNKAVDGYMKFKEVEEVKSNCEETGAISDYLRNKALFTKRKDILDEIMDSRSSAVKKTLFDFS